MSFSKPSRVYISANHREENETANRFRINLPNVIEDAKDVDLLFLSLPFIPQYPTFSPRQARINITYDVGGANTNADINFELEVHYLGLKAPSGGFPPGTAAVPRSGYLQEDLQKLLDDAFGVGNINVSIPTDTKKMILTSSVPFRLTGITDAINNPNNYANVKLGYRNISDVNAVDIGGTFTMAFPSTPVLLRTTAIFLASSLGGTDSTSDNGVHNILKAFPPTGYGDLIVFQDTNGISKVSPLNIAIKEISFEFLDD